MTTNQKLLTLKAQLRLAILTPEVMEWQSCEKCKTSAKAIAELSKKLISAIIALEKIKKGCRTMGDCEETFFTNQKLAKDTLENL